MEAHLGLAGCTAAFEDLHVDRNKALELVDILALRVLAALRGADDWWGIGLFDKIRLSWLLKFIWLYSGVPSHDTVNRVFRMIKPIAFQKAFLA
jgi:hypothetical protein